MTSKPFYQLTTQHGQPTFYTVFDNIEEEERLHIRVMIYHLNSDEYTKVTKEINSVHGEHSIDANEPLEFMKYIVISWKGQMSVVDMDTLRYVHAPEGQSLHKKLVSRTVIQGDELKILQSKSRLSRGPSLHHGDTTLRRARIRFETKKHGYVTLTFSTYADPNIRNGVQLSVENNVQKTTMYGAFVYATNPKFLILKNATKLPRIPTKQKFEEILNSTYWVIDDTPKKYMNKKNNDKILIPKGKVKKQNWETF